jgi:isopentenyl-diphosphate delta-isomerase
VHIFQGDFPIPFEVSGFNRHEVQDVAWVGHDELRERVEEQPARFTPWLRIYLDRWSELALRPAA